MVSLLAVAKETLVTVKKAILACDGHLIFFCLASSEILSFQSNFNLQLTITSSTLSYFL